MHKNQTCLDLLVCANCDTMGSWICQGARSSTLARPASSNVSPTRNDSTKPICWREENTVPGLGSGFGNFFIRQIHLLSKFKMAAIGVLSVFDSGSACAMWRNRLPLAVARPRLPPQFLLIGVMVKCWKASVWTIQSEDLSLHTASKCSEVDL